MVKVNKLRLMDFQNGFTLIEIILTIAILGLMAATFLPLLTTSTSNIFKPGQRNSVLYQAQSQLDNYTGTSTSTISMSVTNPKTITINDPTLGIGNYPITGIVRKANGIGNNIYLYTFMPN